jgi:hypothetical protein
LIDLIASGLTRATAAREEAEADEVGFTQDFAEHGLALSAGSRLSGDAGDAPGRNEPEDGEHP